MRIAILSDVHGNRFALEAVLQDIEKSTPDLVANLGDQVWGMSDPRGAWDVLQGIKAVTVRGNTDELVSSRYDRLEEQAHAYADYVRSQLPFETPDKLAALPITAELAEGEVVIAHGALTDTWDALVFDVTSNPLQPRTEQELLEQAQLFPKAKVFVVGHTHHELLRSAGGISFVNAGPVSRPFDQNPAARWLLLEHHAGQWNISFRRVAYDVEAALTWALKHSPFAEQEASLLRVG